MASLPEEAAAGGDPGGAVPTLPEASAALPRNGDGGAFGGGTFIGGDPAHGVVAGGGGAAAMCWQRARSKWKYSAHADAIK